MTIKTFVTGSPECAAAQAAPGKKHIWVNAAETVIYTGDDLPVPPVPISVTPWQIRKALNASGLRAAVETAVAAGPKDMQDGWEFASEVQRDDPLVVSMGASLGKSKAEIDALFALAASL